MCLHMILQLVAYVGAVVGALFLVLTIALGLYYVSELVEEHTEPTKRLLRRLIQGIITTLVLLLVLDRFPFKLTVFLIASHWVYLQNLHRFPYVQLLSPIFLISCALVVGNHFLWFNHFHNPYIPSIDERLRPGYVPPHIPLFAEVSSFFGLCVWLVPFALFVSLSAHDNLLPHHMESPDKKRNTGLAKYVVGQARDWVYGVCRRFGFELDPTYGTIA